MTNYLPAGQPTSGLFWSQAISRTLPVILYCNTVVNSSICVPREQSLLKTCHKIGNGICFSLILVINVSKCSGLIETAREIAIDSITGISNVEQVARENVGACDKQVSSVRHYVNGTEHSPKSKCLNTNTLGYPDFVQQFVILLPFLNHVDHICIGNVFCGKSGFCQSQFMI